MNFEDKSIVVLGLKRIGDAVYTLPTFEAIKRKYPNCFITIVTEPQVEGIYQGNPYIDEIEVISKKSFWSVALEFLKAKSFDVCIINHNAFKYALLPFLAGIPVRVGYIKELRGFLLTHKRKLHTEVVHRIEHNALLLDLLDVQSRGILPQIYLLEEEQLTQKLLKKNLLESEGYIAFIVGSISPTRRWFPENFAQVANEIITKLKLKVVILGGPDDMEIAEEVVARCEVGDQILNLTGKTSLRETILLFSKSMAVVTNDTGPLHVASALQVPVVTWFGAANEKEIAPPSPRTKVLNANVHCSPCVKEYCPYGLECLVEITPQLVFTSLQNMLESKLLRVQGKK